MRVLSLFSGVGAHDLGLEWAGMQIVGQVEIDDYCTKVLEKHWPKVKRWSNITAVSANDIRNRCGRIDLITGGFPCQDISVAGKQKGIIEGNRSSLWWHMWRLIRDLRPDWLLLENVPALRTNGSDRVLLSLEALGYTCEPLVVGAEHLGAPQKRHRVWIVAKMDNTGGERFKEGGLSSGHEAQHAKSTDTSSISDTDGDTLWIESRRCERPSRKETGFAFPLGPREEQYDWEPPRVLEPSVGGVPHGSPDWLDKNKRLKALGNANPPQIPMLIGRAIVEMNND